MPSRVPLILDTNVLVAAGFRPRSASAFLVELVREGRALLRWHPTTKGEAHRILGRIPRLQWPQFEKLFLDEGLYDGALDLEAFTAVRDPADRKFAALALATDCPLVSSDDDLLSTRTDSVIRILTPAEMRLSLAREEGSEP